MRRRGFSLLELSVVLTIIAIVVAGGLTLGSAKTQQAKMVNNYEELKEIVHAISVFVAQNNRMPCPSDNTALPGTATYGRESAICTGAAATVREGGVPFYALGLPDEYGADDYNNRYLYAVMDDTTVIMFDSSYAGTTIVVNDSGGTPIGGEIVYVLVSAGKTGKGSRNVKTAALKANGTDKDSENWDSDVTFIDGDYNDGEIAANFYDDILLWKSAVGIFKYGGTERELPSGCTNGQTVLWDSSLSVWYCGAN